MRPRLHNGWVVVDHDGPDVANIHIAVGDPDDWKPAFRDYEDRQRVVQVRPPAALTGQVLVWLRVDGAVTGPRPLNL